MMKRTGRMLSATLAAGLVLSMGGAALAAPVGGLKQFKTPTANSQPRYITNGSDGNRWFTESDRNANFAKIARVTPTGTITEFDANCSGCIMGDIVQGPNNILYATSTDPILLRFDLTTGAFLAPISIPNSAALDGNLAVHGTDIWFDDFNNDLLWRYDTTGTGDAAFTQFPVVEPDDVVIDNAGDAWFTAADDQSVNRLDPDTGLVQRFPVPNGLSPLEITIATDRQIWFTSRFSPQGIGRLDPTTGIVTTFPVGETPSTGDPGPFGIAAGTNGAVWFTQEIRGNVARIDNQGVITEGKTVKGSGPVGVVVAPNGDPWYAMNAANKIATLQLR